MCILASCEQAEASPVIFVDAVFKTLQVIKRQGMQRRRHSTQLLTKAKLFMMDVPDLLIVTRLVDFHLMFSNFAERRWILPFFVMISCPIRAGEIPIFLNIV